MHLVDGLVAVGVRLSLLRQVGSVVFVVDQVSLFVEVLLLKVPEFVRAARPTLFVRKVGLVAAVLLVIPLVNREPRHHQVALVVF